MDKTEILSRFSFMKDIFDKVDDPGFKREEMCGVFFYKGNAYCTNNHVIGRIKDSKGVCVDDLLFWSYSQNETCEIVSKNIFQDNFIDQLDLIFDSYAESYFFVKKELLIRAMSGTFRTDPAKARISLCIKVGIDFLDLFFIDKKSKVLCHDRIPLLTFRGKSLRIKEGSSFTVNLLYLFKVTSISLSECDIIGFKLKDDYTHPVIVFNKSSYRPEISWSIAQILVKTK